MNGYTERYIFPRGTSRVSRALRAAAANESVSALAEGLFEIRMRDTSAITFYVAWLVRAWPGASKLPSRLYRKLIVNLGSRRGGATVARPTISVSRVPVNTITWRDSTALSQILKLAPIFSTTTTPSPHPPHVNAIGKPSCRA